MYQGFILGFGPVGALYYGSLRSIEGISMKVLKTPEKTLDERPFFLINSHDTSPLKVIPVETLDLQKIKMTKGPKLIFLTMRANDLEQVLEGLAPHLDHECELVLCQNGIGIYDMAEKLFSHLNIHRILTYAGASWQFDKSNVRQLHISTDRPVVGLFSKVRTTSFLKDLLLKAGFEINESSDVQTVEWRKAVMNIYANPLLALTGLTTSYAVRDSVLRELSLKLAAETVVVAQRLKIDLNMEFVLKIQKITAALIDHRCSTLKDIALGRDTETEWLNGAIVREAKKLGLHAPYNETIDSLIKTFENHRIKPIKVVPEINQTQRKFR